MHSIELLSLISILMFVQPISFLLLFGVLRNGVEATVFRHDIRANGFRTEYDDQYISLTIKAPAGHIIRYEPHASSEHVHHIMLAGCEQPYHPIGLNEGPATCLGRERYLYSWAKNAGNLSLPQDVAYKVGHENDSIQYLVMIIHYANKMTGDYKDNSGLTLVMSKEPTKYNAVEYLFVSGDEIPPGQENYKMNISCHYRSNTKAIPFYYRVHTHDHGKIVSAFIIDPKHKPHLVGKRHPLWPQSFEKVIDPVPAQQGAILAAQCIYNTTGERERLQMGMTNSHEMCNFQIMFYYPAEDPDPFPNSSVCFGNALEEQNLQYPDVKPLPHNQTLLDFAKNGHSHQHEHGNGHRHHHEHGDKIR
ncbi:unnamed protein product [Bursaphelenchus xylophilus]|uniref:peptidylglycine monooxygenase n=1 Tax=Bursaphelenchus xylophilus TaxID=6326 RepID=A0A1I7SS03_BURXY|nr:unnamed protein product [Bursaphelenchus xylophilus]CAG9105852.1 unnamed protein product [Bursaphelenchus xylophilus]